jgi:hypothetical protein
MVSGQLPGGKQVRLVAHLPQRKAAFDPPRLANEDETVNGTPSSSVRESEG